MGETKRRIQTSDGMKLAKKKQRETLSVTNIGLSVDELESRDHSWPTGFPPGTMESRIAWMLLRGYTDRSAFLVECQTATGLSEKKSLKLVKKVEVRLFRLGFRRASVTRVEPPPRLRSLVQQPRCGRPHADAIDSDLPF